MIEKSTFLHAARIKQSFINAPVEEIITKGQHTHVISDVELSSSVEVQDGIEWSGMSEIKLIFDNFNKMQNTYQRNIHFLPSCNQNTRKEFLHGFHSLTIDFSISINIISKSFFCQLNKGWVKKFELALTDSGLYLWKEQEFKIVEEVWPPPPKMINKVGHTSSTILNFSFQRCRCSFIGCSFKSV